MDLSHSLGAKQISDTLFVLTVSDALFFYIIIFKIILNGSSSRKKFEKLLRDYFENLPNSRVSMNIALI